MHEWQAGDTCNSYVDLFWGGLIDKLGQGRLIQGQIIAAFHIGVVEGHSDWSFWHIAKHVISLNLQDMLWAVKSYK